MGCVDLSGDTEGSEGASPLQACSFVVEDDALIRMALASTLEEAGLRAIEVDSVAALEAALASQEAQLVFLDLNLGTSGGSDALWVLSRYGYQGLVQVMSGRSSTCIDDAVLLGRMYGMTMLPPLAKPFRLSEVKALAEGLAPFRRVPSVADDQDLRVKQTP